MAISVLTQPGDYASVNAPTIYVADSTNKNTANFKYIFDVYVASTLVARLKAFPDSDYGYGVCDVSQILREYINSNYFKKAEFTADEFIGNNGEFYIEYDLKCGEEVTGTITSGLTTINHAAYNVAYSDCFNFNAEILEPNYIDKVLVGNYRRRVGDNENNVIPIFNDTGASTISITTKTYDAGGSLIDTFPYLMPALGGCTHVDLGTRTLQEVNPSVNIEDVKYYTCDIDVSGTVSNLTFDVVCEPRFTAKVLHFLNGLGGYETKSFRLASKPTLDFERKKFQQIPYKLNSDGSVSTNTSGVYREQSVTYATKIGKKMKLQADFITKEEYEWLAQLISSPVIYLEDGSNYWPVHITNTNYELVNPAENMKFLELEIEFSHMGNSQYR